MKFKILNHFRVLKISCLSMVLVSLFILTVPLPKAFAMPAEQEHTAKLLDGAKKEGKLVLYSTTGTQDTNALVTRFNKRYPQIKTEVYRSGAEKLLTKIMAEAAAKRYASDVIIQNGIIAKLLKERGILAPYYSPQREFYQEDFKDPEGHWTDIYMLLNVIGYNTKLVSPKELPRAWADFLDPRWKGKMVMDNKAFEWLAGIFKIMGEEKGLEFIKKLSYQNISFRAGRTLNCQMLAAGEGHIGIALYNNQLEQMKGQGAPVDWLAIEPVIQGTIRIGLAANASHPNAGKLFTDFVLSKEGQEIIASFYRIPSRTDVDAVVPKLKKGLKLLSTGFMHADDFSKYMKLYQDILMKKRN